MIIGLTGRGNRTLLAETIQILDNRFVIKSFAGKLLQIASIIGNFDPTRYPDYAYRREPASVFATVEDVVIQVKRAFILDHFNIFNESLIDEYTKANDLALSSLSGLDGAYWIITDVKEEDQALRILDLGGKVYKTIAGSEPGDINYQVNHLLDPFITQLPKTKKIEQVAINICKDLEIDFDESLIMDLSKN